MVGALILSPYYRIIKIRHLESKLLSITLQKHRVSLPTRMSNTQGCNQNLMHNKTLPSPLGCKPQASIELIELDLRRMYLESRDIL